MSITSGSNNIAEEKLLTVQLRAVLGAYEIAFLVSGTVHAQRDVSRWYQIHGARVVVRSVLGLRDLGEATLRAPTIILQHQNGGYFDIEFIVLLQATQIAALEEHRNAGDLEFELRIVGVSGIGSEAGDYRHQQTLTARIAESSWVAQLLSARALDILLLEVPMPIAGASQKQKAISTHLKKAQRLFTDGHYSDCVSESRKALEELTQGINASWATLANKTDREGMAKQERLRAILLTLLHYTHLAAHSESRGGTADYSRGDARLVLSLVATHVAHEASGQQ